MKVKTVRLLVLLCFAVVAGFLFLMSREVIVLELENGDRPRAIRIAVNASERFSLSYVHSIYDAPVTEDFQVEGQGIVLKGVRTKNRGVMEYYGFADGREFHPMHVPLGTIMLRVGLGAGQRLTVRDRRIHLSELGTRGDRVRLRIVPIPLGSYLLSTLSVKLRGQHP